MTKIMAGIFIILCALPITFLLLMRDSNLLFNLFWAGTALVAIVMGILIMTGRIKPKSSPIIFISGFVVLLIVSVTILYGNQKRLREKEESMQQPEQRLLQRHSQ